MKWLAVLLLACVASVSASEMAGVSEAVSVCYNYGCLSEDDVLYSGAQLSRVQGLLDDSRSAVHERALLGVAVGWMLGWAGQQTPVSADRGGNHADDGVHGRMDCIDHATTTTRLLRLFERRGWLRFHRVVEPALRTNFLIFDHYSAQIEALEAGAPDGNDAERHVVDSWFFDNGQPAVVMPLQGWLAGEGPDVKQ